VAGSGVICGRDNADLARTRRLGSARFEQMIRREITRAGGQKTTLRIIRNLFAALDDPAGVLAHRRGALDLGTGRVVPRTSDDLVPCSRIQRSSNGGRDQGLCWGYRYGAVW
jgi:hypothetical protein